MSIALLLGSGLVIIILFNTICVRILVHLLGLEEYVNDASKDIED